MAKKAVDPGVVFIPLANMVTTTIRIRSTAPVVQEAFSGRKRDELMAGMSTSKAEKAGKARKDARPARNYDDEFEEAQHKAVAGWNGIPCTAFRQAMVDACRTANVVMVTAKLAISIIPDGFDVRDGTPLVRLYSQTPPERLQLPVRNANGSVDIRVRPMWREWWADVTVRFDADMITAQSIVNLLDRAGQQVGVGAGRPFSKKSVGQGWGTFVVDQERSNKEAKTA
jgi:hypothetical protein